MKRLRWFLLLVPLIYLVAEFDSDGQSLWRYRRWEAGAGLGTSFFFGDIGGYTQGENALGFKDLSALQTRLSGNANIRYRVLENLNVRLNISAANLRATDTRGSNEGRKYETRMFIFEPAALGEYYFIKNGSEGSWLFNKGRGGALRRLITSMDFYAFTGLGAAFYNVKANAILEGREEYTRLGPGITPVIPVGIGGTLIYSAEYNFGIEVGGRYSFSDYIDGYSNDNYSSANDVYYFLNFTFTYKMTVGRNGLPTFLNRSNGRRR